MLVPLASLKTALGIDDDVQDALLTMLLEEAEADIGAAYNLPTVPAVEEQLRILFADGSYLPLFECSSVDSVTDIEGAELTFTEVPGRLPSDFIKGISFPAPYTGTVRVTGAWGHAATPADVRRAITITAATYYKRKSFGTDDAPYRGGGASIPQEARDIMRARRVE